MNKAIFSPGTVMDLVSRNGAVKAGARRARCKSVRAARLRALETVNRHPWNQTGLVPVQSTKQARKPVAVSSYAGSVTDGCGQTKTKSLNFRPAGDSYRLISRTSVPAQGVTVDGPRHRRRLHRQGR